MGKPVADNSGLMPMIDPSVLAKLLAQQGQQGQPPNPFDTFQRPTPAPYSSQRYGTPFDRGALNELFVKQDRGDRIDTGRMPAQQNALWDQALGMPEQPTNFQTLYNALMRGAKP